MTAIPAADRIDCLLLDLDGVIRHFDPAAARAAEALHGLEPGVIPRAAFAPEILDRVVTGRMNRREWTEHVGSLVGSQSAAEDWLADRGHIDHEVIATVREVRGGGVTVAILTNGTDTIDEELRDHGVAHEFDHVFNTHFIGVAKPRPGAYHHVVDHLGTSPGRILFFDDKTENVTGASAVGLRARLFEGAESMRAHLCRLGLVTG